MTEKREFVLEDLRSTFRLILNSRNQIDMDVDVIAPNDKHQVLLSVSNQTHGLLQVLPKDQLFLELNLRDSVALP